LPGSYKKEKRAPGAPDVIPLYGPKKEKKNDTMFPKIS
jgi:hypothetical protein